MAFVHTFRFSENHLLLVMICNALDDALSKPTHFTAHMLGCKFGWLFIPALSSKSFQTVPPPLCVTNFCNSVNTISCINHPLRELWWSVLICRTRAIHSWCALTCGQLTCKLSRTEWHQHKHGVYKSLPHFCADARGERIDSFDVVDCLVLDRSV